MSPGASGPQLVRLELLELQFLLFSEVRGREQGQEETLQSWGQRQGQVSGSQEGPGGLQHTALCDIRWLEWLGELESLLSDLWWWRLSVQTEAV